MNQESGAATREPLAHARHLNFSTLFPTTRRGAHTARHAAEQWLADHLTPEERDGGDLAATASLLVAELAANSALHGRVRGREARLVVTLDATEVRVEVSDARGDRLPVKRPGEGGESGRGLLLVEALADDWGVRPHAPGGKTVWALCRR
ncbi:ATP-binding protein [Streptomyces sp. S1D4-11]|nr:ATP-binding protein [Streptomyces sp. S1D4-11]QIY94506.1 ATP-binding protein [Streptomyces sp. S1D4-11]